jgi:uncharacterized membrane-anchored protein
MRASSLIARLAHRRGRDHARSQTAVARLDRHTRRLAARLAPGEIAVIHHLVDQLGDGLFGRLRDGDRISLDGDAVLLGNVELARGVRQDAVQVATTMSAAGAGAHAQVRSVVAAIPQLFDDDAALLLRGEGMPSLRSPIAGRPCLVLARGHRHREDLARLRPFIRQRRPVLIGVDGGADVLLAAGLTPHVIVGDLDAVSGRALRCGAELVARLSADNRAYGAARLAALNLPWAGFPATLAAEELGVLLAEAHGASLVVTAGMGGALPALLDRGRAGSASSLLTRMCLSDRVAHAQAVAALHRPSVSARAFAGALTAVVAVTAVVVATGGWLHFG